MKRFAGVATALLVVLAACSGGGTPPVPSQPSIAAQSNVRAGCGGPVPTGYVRCFDLVRTDVGGGNPNGYHGLYAHAGTRTTQLAIGSPSGYGPPDLQSAYALKSASATGGKGMTVAIVDSNDDPNAESDLGVYRSQYGLPACTTANGCFRKVDQNGGTSYPLPDAGWSTEISLDLDMASAICPNCHILLVEAQLPLTTDLDAAVNTAARLGANVISNSYGGSEGGASDSAFNHPGIVITASTGDSGYSGGVMDPSAYSNVVAVGGTSLTRASNARGWTETAWSGADSGCSAYVVKPSWQHDACAMRNVADVAAVADPNTGVAVYDTVPYEGGVGWQVVGGTSASSPIVAAVYALAGNASSQNAASGLYANTTYLNDVVSGSNGTCASAYECNAGTGYDGPTGLGTPNGTGAF
jgi:subtilase family serine protease